MMCGAATRVKEALIDAADRGARVQVLLDVSNDEDFSTEANRGVAKALRQRGIAVHLDSPARTTHTKMVIIDQRYVFLGSHNRLSPGGRWCGISGHCSRIAGTCRLILRHNRTWYYSSQQLR